MALTDLPFVKNHLWPLVMGAIGAAITALSTGLPAALLDGIQLPQDALLLGGTALSAALGYVATIMKRHAGKNEPWVDPAK